MIKGKRTEEKRDLYGKKKGKEEKIKLPENTIELPHCRNGGTVGPV